MTDLGMIKGRTVHIVSATCENCKQFIYCHYLDGYKEQAEALLNKALAEHKCEGGEIDERIE